MDQARDAHARAAGMSAAQRRPPLWLLIAITAIAPFALNVFVPSMPGLAAQFGAGPDEAQLTLTFFLVGVAVGQLACGPISDRLGRRPVLLAGLALFTAATLLCLLAPTLPLLIAGRLLQALGACAGLVLGRAIVRDTVDPAHVAGALGILNGVMAAAPAIAPAIGGFLDTWQGWRASFLVLLALGAILLALAWLRLTETLRQDMRPASGAAVARGYVRLLATRAFLRYALIVGFNSGAFFAFIAAAPHLTIDVLGERPSSYGIWFLAISFTFITGNLSGGLLSRRIGIDRMIGLGTLLSVVACASLVAGSLLPLSMPAIFLPMAMTALANGWVQPNAIAGAVAAAPHLAGSAAGLTGFAQMAVGAVLTLLVGATLTDRLLEPALVMMGTLAAGIAAYRFLAPSNQAKPKAD